MIQILWVSLQPFLFCSFLDLLFCSAEYILGSNMVQCLGSQELDQHHSSCGQSPFCITYCMWMVLYSNDNNNKYNYDLNWIMEMNSYILVAQLYSLIKQKMQKLKATIDQGPVFKGLITLSNLFYCKRCWKLFE